MVSRLTCIGFELQFVEMIERRKNMKVVGRQLCCETLYTGVCGRTCRREHGPTNWVEENPPW